MALIPSKIYLYLLNPFSISLLLLIFSCILLPRRKKSAHYFLIAAISILWLTSTSFFSSILITSLERRYLPTPVSKSPNADAIVLLGSAVKSIEPPRLEVDLTESSDRILHAAKLYKAGKAPIVISVGGGVQWLEKDEPESNLMAILLMEWGVPNDVILTENFSLNTRENAVYTKNLLDKNNINSVLLVTSAIHMPRALAAFQSAGINAIPSPTDYLIVDKDKILFREFLPDPKALEATTAALKEYLGFLYYRLRGWIK